MSIGVSKPARITPTEVGASLLRWDDRAGRKPGGVRR